MTKNLKERLSFFVIIINFLLIGPLWSKNLNIIFVGDMMLASPIDQMIKNNVDPFLPTKSIFLNSDINIGNLETNVGTVGAPIIDKPYTFQAMPLVVSYLKKKMSAVSLANNHSGDYGKLAFIQMIEILQQNKLDFFGGGMDIKEAHEPLLIYKNNFKIAILGFNMFLPRSFEAMNKVPGIAWGDREQILEDIKKVKKSKPDYIFVYPHWGVEHTKKPYQEQIDFAHQMIDAGADAIIGNHTHATQTIEIYKKKPIFYSLGNFIFPNFDDKTSNIGWILKFKLSKNKLNWKIHEVLLDAKGIPHLTNKTLDLQSSEIKS